MKRLAALALSLLAACATQPDRPAPIRLDLPEMRSFVAQSPGPALRPNSEIAFDFLDLAFRMENGRELPIFTRFDEPVTVRVAGNVSETLVADLTGLLDRKSVV